MLPALVLTILALALVLFLLYAYRRQMEEMAHI